MKLERGGGDGRKDSGIHRQLWSDTEQCQTVSEGPADISKYIHNSFQFN